MRTVFLEGCLLAFQMSCSWMLSCVVFQWEEVNLGAFLLDRPRIILY